MKAEIEILRRMNVGNETLKSKIRAVLDYVRVDQQTLLDSLSDEARAEVGTIAQWSFKDVIVHSTFWWGNFQERLDASHSGTEIPKSIENYDEVNDALQEQHKHDNWERVLAEDARVMQAIYAWLEKLDDQTLKDKEKYPWMHGRPVFNQFLGNCWHDEWHFARYLVVNGRLPEAAAMHEAFVEQIKPIEDWHGVAVYNLACFYAVSGMKTEAIKTLRKALKLRPDLKVCANEDPDFESLHKEPEYQALYN